MSTEVATTVVETAEAVAPVVAPVSTGTLNWKKVAIYAGIGVGVAGCGYVTYRIIKKRKAAKAEIIEVNPEEGEFPPGEIVAEAENK